MTDLNIKITVKNELESTIAQNLLFRLGVRWLHSGFEVQPNLIGVLFTNICNGVPIILHYEFSYEGSLNRREVTINELTDMVLLKRNNESDCTHYGSDASQYFLVLSNGTVKSYDKLSKAWVTSYVSLEGLSVVNKFGENLAKELLGGEEVEPDKMPVEYVPVSNKTPQETSNEPLSEVFQECPTSVDDPLNHRVAQAFNALRAADLTEGDVACIRTLIELVYIQHLE